RAGTNVVDPREREGHQHRRAQERPLEPRGLDQLLALLVFVSMADDRSPGGFLGRDEYDVISAGGLRCRQRVLDMARVPCDEENALCATHRRRHAALVREVADGDLNSSKKPGALLRPSRQSPNWSPRFNKLGYQVGSNRPRRTDNKDHD